MISGDRSQIRQFIAAAWRKHRQGAPLEPIEQIIAAVVARHPEYHALLEAPPPALAEDFPEASGQENPFLHLGLHIALSEQLNADRPPGITGLFGRLSSRLGDPHRAEHGMLECLGRIMWQAGQDGRMPDEQAYLDCVRRLL